MAVDIQTMLVNLERSYPGIIRLITSFSFVSGMAFVLNALYKLKVYGEIRTMMGGQTDLKGPLLMLMTGSVFLFLPTAIDTMMMTAFATPNISPLSYITSETPNFQLGMHAVLGLVQIVGLVSFIRGWFIITKSSAHGQGGAGKGIVHIFGDIMAMNIAGVKSILWATFGF